MNRSDGGSECQSPTKSFAYSRRDSITKLRKALSVRGSQPAEIIDLSVQSEDNEFLNSRLPVDKQLATLKAIQDYNASLPKARKIKDALPAIKTHGITA